jgi:hypothetical protein
MSTFSSCLSLTHNPQHATRNFIIPTQQLNRSTTQRSSYRSLTHSPAQLIFTLLLVLASFFFFAQQAYSGSVTLAWDPNSPSENIAGYKIYYGTESRSYTGVIDITNGTLKKVSKLAKGYHYYFAATAYNDAGEESDFSEEVMVNTCTYKLSPGRKTFKPEGGVATVKVVTQTNCDWTATSGAGWVEIMDGHSGKGPGVITYSVEPNSTPEKKTAGSTFAGKTFTVTQKGSSIGN